LVSNRSTDAGLRRFAAICADRATYGVDDTGPDSVVASDGAGPAGTGDVAVAVLPDVWVGSEEADSGALASAPLGDVVPVLSVLGVSADVVAAPGVVAGAAAVVVVVEAEEFDADESVVSVVLAAAAGVVAATVAPALDRDAGSVVVPVAVVLGVAGDAAVEVAGASPGAEAGASTGAEAGASTGAEAGASTGAEAGARLAGPSGVLVEAPCAVVVVGAVVLSRVTGIDAELVAVVFGGVTRAVVVAAREPDVEAGEFAAVGDADPVVGTPAGSDGAD
jgi:hypothetical protein